MRILALITLFHPSPEVADNMASYASGADALFLWDNTPGGAVLSLPVEAEKKVIRYRRGANVGIGKALNEAVRLLEEGGFTHLLTMDQDSAFVPSTFEAYKRQVAGWQDKRPVVFVPRVNVSRKTTEDWVETQGFIVSGSIFPRFTLSFCVARRFFCGVSGDPARTFLSLFAGGWPGSLAGGCGSADDSFVYFPENN